MSELATLEASPRDSIGKQVAKQLRLAGQLPAVIYGQGIKPVKCQVNQRAFDRLLSEHGRNAVISLSVAGGSNGSHSTIIKDIQHHPVTGRALHVDFHKISLTERIVVEVTVHAQGTAEGVKNGGVLEQRLHGVQLQCLPTAIPEEILVDVSALGIGDAIHVSDLTPPAGSTFATEGDRSVFVVVPPTVRKMEAEEAAAAAAVVPGAEEIKEPEVIERGKKEEDEEGEGR